MRQFIRRHLPVAITAAVICTLFSSGLPIAQAAFDAVNADKVDGKHAVAANATLTQRASKLVATNAAGRLPDNIIATAPNAAQLGGQPPSAYRTGGNGLRGSFANIDGCGSGTVMTYRIDVAQPTRIFAAASSTYGRSNPGPERPTLRVQLLDGAGTVVAQTGRVSVDATSGNPSLSIAGMMLTSAGAPYSASAGMYTLRLWADNFGACTGFGQYQQPELSHLEIPV